MPPLCMYGPVSSTFRRPGALKAPCAPAGLAAERGRLSGPIEAPMPRSLLMRRTPVLKNPVSEPPLTRPLAWILEAEAELVSAPLWHLEHCPLPVKMPMPLCSWALRAPWLPSRNWSTRESLETSVASYIWMASPQMREKLASIIENRFCAAAAPADRIVRLPSALIWMTLLESHHSGWIAARIIASYFDLRPVPGAALREPSALSSGATCCDASARAATIFRPRSTKVRPAKDISKSLSGGPTACDAREELFNANSGCEPSIRLTSCGASPRAATRRTLAPGSRFPMGSTPLNSFRARPSQKLRKLNTALIIVGVLRGSTRRTFPPLTRKIGSGMEIPASVALPTITLVKVMFRTPWEDTMSLVSNRTAEFRSLGFASLWSGKSLAFNWKFRPSNWNVASVGTSRNPGSIWFFDRLSAPAWKWQLAQDWPSLPTCWSQNRALPRAMAAFSSLMNRARFVGRGTATVLSEAKPLPPPEPPSFASATVGCCRPTSNAAAEKTTRALIARTERLLFLEAHV